MVCRLVSPLPVKMLLTKGFVADDHVVPSRCSQSCACKTVIKMIQQSLTAADDDAHSTRPTANYLVALAALVVAEPGPAHDARHAGKEEHEDAKAIVSVHPARFGLLAGHQQPQLLHT